MTGANGTRTCGSRRSVGFRIVLIEAVAVGIAGAALSLAANSVSPRGLKLWRDYFPGAIRPGAFAVTGATNAAGTATVTTNVTELVAARLKAKGLIALGLDRVKQLFSEARRMPDLVVFVDARDEKQYMAGHIPGAFLFDHYRAERYLPDVLPVCMNADQIVLYCYGGDCEDSEFAAVILRDAGVPNEKLGIYTGGFAEWSTNGLPVELGQRNSGVPGSEER